MARLLGVECERINFSANTTLEQLYGSYVPTLLNGKRVFSWQDGRLVQAIRAGKWLLLDEINLAPAEVLDRLAVLLDPSSSRSVISASDSPAAQDCACRNFIVPGSEELLDIRNLHVFATMNPTSVGGGRSHLPQSISCLFMMVKLEEHASDELWQILRGLFACALATRLITDSQLCKLFELHMEVVKQVKARDLGRLGGPYDFNLRDMAKVRDVLQGCMQDHMCHYGFLPKTQQEVQQASYGDIANLAIRQYLQLVYAQRFQDTADQTVVYKLIESKFPGMSVTVPESLSIDSSVSKYVRIGSIYLSKHGEPSNTVPAVHTPETIRQLELLAVACQSGRSVLLEGDTCSRKTLLVRELARLAGSKLLVLSLNQDTETSALIGQWLPMKVSQSLLGCTLAHSGFQLLHMPALLS